MFEPPPPLQGVGDPSSPANPERSDAAQHFPACTRRCAPVIPVAPAPGRATRGGHNHHSPPKSQSALYYRVEEFLLGRGYEYKAVRFLSARPLLLRRKKEEGRRKRFRLPSSSFLLP